MHYTFFGLVNNEPVADWYKTATKHWREVLGPIDQTSSEEIGKVAQMEPDLV